MLILSFQNKTTKGGGVKDERERERVTGLLRPVNQNDFVQVMSEWRRTERGVKEG